MPKKVKSKPPTIVTPDEEENAEQQRFVLKALVLENEACPIEDWLIGIRDNRTRQRIGDRLDRIERGNLGDFHLVGDGAFAFRLDFGPGYRIYYARVGTTIIVLSA